MGAAPLARFDCAAAWDRLPPEQQRALGVVAIALGLSHAGTEACATPIHAWEAAFYATSTVLEDMVAAHVRGGAETYPLPDLAALGVASCRICGCTDDYACEGGCGWIEPDLCSACAEAEGES